jgi:hypothetical protein
MYDRDNHLPASLLLGARASLPAMSATARTQIARSLVIEWRREFF